MLLVFFLPFFGFGQASQVLVVGNIGKMCFPNDSIFQYADCLPPDLDQYNSVLLFSSAGTGFRSDEIDRLVSFVSTGGGLYLGSENMPLQTESNQLTNRLYSKSSYGSFETSIAQCADNGNLRLNELDSIPAGQTIVAFPLDHRLTVEAWVEDQPLILSGNLGDGRIIIDGGYSRFYCENKSDLSNEIFKRIMLFLNIT